MVQMFTTPPKFSETPNAIREDVPVYVLEESCYFDDTHWLAGAILETSEKFIPNTAMFPLNQKAYDYMVALLSDYDEKGAEWSVKERKSYVKKLPAFESKWLHMNTIAKQRRMSLVMVLKAVQAPILGAPTRERTVAQVDMTSMPQLPYQDNSAIGKGNTMDKDMSAANAVRMSVA